MVPSLRSAPSKRSLLRWAGTVVAAFVAVTVMVRPTQNAIANGDTRVLNIYHTHTRETLQVTFKRNGTYDQDGLKKLNWFLRDWRRDEPTRMDPRLFDIVWAAYREVGGSQPIGVPRGRLVGMRVDACRHQAVDRGAVARHLPHEIGHDRGSGYDTRPGRL